MGDRRTPRAPGLPLPASWLAADHSLSFDLRALRAVASTAYSSLPPWLVPSFRAAWERQQVLRPGDVVVDGTANVGIELFVLVSLFRVRGYAYEIDPDTFGVLSRNVSALRWDGRVVPMLCDTAAVVDGGRGAPHELPEAAVVYFDPPWGGPAYRDLPEVRLTLSGRDITDLAAAALARAAAVVIKAPLNLEPGVFFRLVARGYDVQVETVAAGGGRPVFDLYFVRSRRPPLPAALPPAVSAALEDYFESRFIPCLPAAARTASRGAFADFVHTATAEARRAALEELGAQVLAGGRTEGAVYGDTSEAAAQQRARKRAASVRRELKWAPVAGAYLDVGGGDESITVAVAETIPEVTDATCVDPAPAGARPCAKPLRAIRAPAEEAPPPPGGYYGLATCLMSLHHVERQTAAAERLAAVCAPGAQLVVREHALGCEPGWSRAATAQFLDTVHRVFQVMEGAASPDEVPTQYRTPREWELLLRGAGFVPLGCSGPRPRGGLWSYTAAFARLPLRPDQQALLPPSPLARAAPLQGRRREDRGRGRRWERGGRGRGRATGRGQGPG